MYTHVYIDGGKGGARGLKPPLRIISHRNYLSWSGAENRDKDRDTLIEQSLYNKVVGHCRCVASYVYLKDFYVVYQLEMVVGEVESSCQLVITFFFFFFLVSIPNYRNKSGSAQPPLISTTSSAAACIPVYTHVYLCTPVYTQVYINQCLWLPMSIPCNPLSIM